MEIKFAQGTNIHEWLSYLQTLCCWHSKEKSRWQNRTVVLIQSKIHTICSRQLWKYVHEIIENIDKWKYNLLHMYSFNLIKFLNAIMCVSQLFDADLVYCTIQYFYKSFLTALQLWVDLHLKKSQQKNVIINQS